MVRIYAHHEENKQVSILVLCRCLELLAAADATGADGVMNEDKSRNASDFALGSQQGLQDGQVLALARNYMIQGHFQRVSHEVERCYGSNTAEYPGQALHLWASGKLKVCLALQFDCYAHSPHGTICRPDQDRNSSWKIH